MNVASSCRICDEPTEEFLCEFHKKARELLGSKCFYYEWGIDEQEVPATE